MAAETRYGPVPKGDRQQLTFRLPRTHLELYRQRAQEAGLPLGDYLVLCLADNHGLEEPGYIHWPRKGQGELPISA